MGCRCTKESLVIENVKYYIMNRIAEGGFGTVELVEEAKSRHLYALKRVKCDNKNDLDKATTENRFYKQLNNNPNIIKLIADDILEDKKTQGYFIVSIFPFCHNGNLQQELDQNQKRTILIKNDRVLKLFKGVCNALRYIHDSNLAHRDLKPQNILIGDDLNTAILTDFGSMTERQIEIASIRKSQEIQEWAAQNCSIFYKSPELFNPKVNSVLSEKADIWSLGCVLYALLFNKGPFDYVVERGDSIALAVQNVKYTIPSIPFERAQTLLNVIKSTILHEPSSRSSLSKIIADIDEISSFDNHNGAAGTATITLSRQESAMTNATCSISVNSSHHIV